MVVKMSFRIGTHILSYVIESILECNLNYIGLRVRKT